ncbi:torsin-1A [Strongylocentrotus purpuratus]|uniref:Torsin-1A C-terminal domain-containing protein n=1 Tax=Strongylocentrotus purpuratus TaxID=7668 RepID=A0A7M7PR66_STRPU|nr:torsin-1A [Strongylocentrotus purpuratus]
MMWGVAFYGFFFMLCSCVLNSQAGVALWTKKHLHSLNPLCYGTIECCFHKWTYRPDIDALAKAFDDHLFGQPLAQTTVLGAIDGHVTNPNPPKPLVLSLHGPAGTGKNHISRLTVESLFKHGMDSSFVTLKISTKDFPHKAHLEKYKEELVSLIKSKVSSCPHHVFIFDEVENMPAGLLDNIKGFLDHHTKVEGTDYRKAIFIFRSNLAAQAINKHVWESYEKGIAREDIPLVEMERIIMNEVSENPDAGFYKARIISSHLVSHFIPFFPLEASHVRQCIHAEFKVRGYASTSSLEDDVLAQLQFNGPRGSRVFAVKGCKNVAEKVNILLYKLKAKGHTRHTDL